MSDDESSEKFLSSKNLAVVAGLAAGKSTAELAAETGLTDRAIRKRRHDPEVLAMRAAMIEKAVNELAASASRAATALDRLLDDSDGKTVVAAARAILANLLAMHERDELIQRIADIEARLAKGNDNYS